MEHLVVQSFCEQQVEVSEGPRKRRFQEMQLDHLKSALQSSSDIPTNVTEEASKKLRCLEETIGSKSCTTEESLALFKKKYPGIYQENPPKVNWETDIILPQSLKEELYNIAMIALKFYTIDPVNSQKGRKKSIFFYGVPGVGKTLICHGIATLAGNVNVFKITPAEICQSYFGDGEKTVKMTFQTVRKTVPSLLVIDEIDSVGQ